MKLLVINPGSTSSKISLYEEKNLLFEEDVFHDADVLLQYPTVNDQIPFRKQLIEKMIVEHGYSLEDIDVYVGRGGSAVPCQSGVMEINEQLYKDTKNEVGGSQHPAKLGVMMAYQFGQQFNKPCYTLNPTNVDELDDIARITGIAGVYNNAQSHVLNQKAVAMHHSELMGRKYEESDYIVCHIDGGITVNAHHLGRMIDGNVGAGGSGAFTPTRIGDVPVLRLLDYLENHSIEEVRTMCSRSGGFVSHFGTSNSDTIYKMVEDGDEKATLIWNAMIYQICKQIGAMSTVLKGHVDAIILTGGLVRFDSIVNQIKERCGWISDIYVYPGEMEQQSLAFEVLKVLHGNQTAKQYTGQPVFKGFDF